ncbi:MAG: OmpH family outer membrane protein [Prevotellaceae bacterium]|nr:OmpH family outer membrane protein [Prevotellaceae bacterium]
MMRRTLVIALLLLPFTLSAQIRIGYVSYEKLLHAMPEYAQAEEDLRQLKAQYDDEATRGEDEFQRKFTEFLEGQKDFPQNILLKRQAELQALMENGLSFRQEAQGILEETERQLISELEKRLNAAIQEVGASGGFLCILNTDGNQCPFINQGAGEDVTFAVLQKLGLAEAGETEEEGQPEALPEP